MPAVYIRAAARRDLVGHFVYLAENASFDIANRYLSSAETSFTGLAQQPMIGSPLSPHRPELAGMRKWRVKDFDNFLIFIYHATMAYLSCACCTPRRTGGSCSEWKHEPE